MIGRPVPPRWLLQISRALLRWRVTGRDRDERVEEHVGDVVELWVRRREAGRRALTLRSTRDVGSIPFEDGAVRRSTVPPPASTRPLESKSV